MSTDEAARTGNVAWFHCFAGIAGDMALGSLIDAGASLDEIRRVLERLPIGGWELDAEPVLRCGIAATHVIVRVRDDGLVRTYAHIAGIIEEARLPERVRSRAAAAFAVLAAAEGRIHRRNPAQAHFHEVGGHDAIVDIVGTATALELLGVDTVTSSAVATGTGVVRTSHGLLPNPVPAVVDLLEGIPSYGLDVNAELTTPTGAAILAAMSSGSGPMPAMTIEATGFGAGTRELDGLPNCTQVVIGRSSDDASAAMPGAGQPVLVLETNIDDATGETLSHALGALLEAGAYDAWLTPVMMKKGRPGHVLSVIADAALAASLRRVILDETGSLGVRAATAERWPVPRDTEHVWVGGLPVRVKVSPGRVKAEHDDAARVGRRLGMPLREVSALAEASWRQTRERSGSTAAPNAHRGPPADEPPSPADDGPPAPVVGIPSAESQRRRSHGVRPLLHDHNHGPEGTEE
jgi:uncharacterized protein (TIGR00299 family) protein